MSLGPQAFAYCQSLKSVVVPNSVTNIGDSAFSPCASLTNAVIGDGVTTLGLGAFQNCARLTSVTIGRAVVSLPDSVFDSCSSLTNVTLPCNIVNVGARAFANCFNLATVTILGSVTNLGNSAFSSYGLTAIYFAGDAPTLGVNVFGGYVKATAYYIPGTFGWGSTFGGLTTAPWFLPEPVILNHGPTFGVLTNRFGFTIAWATNIAVVVETCTDPTKHAWSSVATNYLTGGCCYFCDPDWTNHPARFYRVRAQ